MAATTETPGDAGMQTKESEPEYEIDALLELARLIKKKLAKQ